MAPAAVTPAVAALVVAGLVGLVVLLAAPAGARRLDAALVRRVDSPGRWAPSPPDAYVSRGRPLPRAPASDVALLMDLVAAALAAGLPPARALAVAGESLPGACGTAVERVAALWLLGATHEAAWEGAPPGLEPLQRTLLLVATAGIPGVPLLRSAADELRRFERRAAEARAQALGVRLVLPLGLCALPAFVAWAVVPVVLSLAAQVLG